jgi:hypothetical protein
MSAYQMPRRAIHAGHPPDIFESRPRQLEQRRMSERRPIPPMQYAPPEDGHHNHGAVDVKEALTIPAAAGLSL